MSPITGWKNSPLHLYISKSSTSMQTIAQRPSVEETHFSCSSSAVVILFPPIHRMKTRVLGVLNKEAQPPPPFLFHQPLARSKEVRRSKQVAPYSAARSYRRQTPYPSREQYRNMLNQSESTKYSTIDQGLNQLPAVL